MDELGFTEQEFDTYKWLLAERGIDIEDQLRIVLEEDLYLNEKNYGKE